MSYAIKLVLLVKHQAFVPVMLFQTLACILLIPGTVFPCIYLLRHTNVLWFMHQAVVPVMLLQALPVLHALGRTSHILVFDSV